MPSMMIISIKYSQIEAGMQASILERLDIPIPNLTPTWVMSIQQFLYEHNLFLTITSSIIHIHYQGRHDACILDQEKLRNFTQQGNQHSINLVWLVPAPSNNPV
jgi:hypothetical protein